MRMKGFTLLEMIITLAIMGVAMMSIISYKEKEADESRRQLISNALISEIDGILKFVSEEKINVRDKNGIETEIPNPLYDTNENKPYTNRTHNKNLNDGLSDKQDEIIDWSAGKSTRVHFTRKSCISTGTQGKYDFVNDYIPCNEPDILANSEIRINRIDLVGKNTTTGSAIERVDFILSYDKLSADDTFYFTKYLSSMEKAAEKYSVTLKDIYVLKRTNSTANGWAIVNVAGETLTLSNLAKHIALLDKTAVYGLRLSIDPGSGQFLRADGRVGADRLCWNVAAKMTGPCLYADDTNNNLVLTKGSGSSDQPGMCWDLSTGTSKLCLTQTEGKDEAGNPASLLALKDQDKNPATILADVLVKEVSDKNEVYRTIPNIQYVAFENGSDAELIPNPQQQPGGQHVMQEKGYIDIPVQKCPVLPNNSSGKTLHPRLTAAVSSIIAETKDNSGTYQADFTNLSSNRNVGGNAGLLGGVAIQVNRVAQKWIISATMGIINPIDQSVSVYVNPKFLSLTVTTWCSTEQQN
ncbi:type II secretion system protein [Escherichia coli]|uniref:type II secretion system protein n=1 Tax=Escherichia coli TaxID=562 RepID=UPI0038B2AD94